MFWSERYLGKTTASCTVSTLVPVVLVLQEYGIYTRSCSSALRGACSSCVLALLCGQRADGALSSPVARLPSLLCRPEGILSCVCGVICYIYSLLLACSCVLVELVPQYGIYTHSCSIALKACSCALAFVVFVGTTV